MDDLADGDKKPAAIDTSGGGAVINKRKNCAVEFDDDDDDDDDIDDNTITICSSRASSKKKRKDNDDDYVYYDAKENIDDVSDYGDDDDTDKVGTRYMSQFGIKNDHDFLIKLATSCMNDNDISGGFDLTQFDFDASNGIKADCLDELEKNSLPSDFVYTHFMGTLNDLLNEGGEYIVHHKQPSEMDKLDKKSFPFKDDDYEDYDVTKVYSSEVSYKIELHIFIKKLEENKNDMQHAGRLDFIRHIQRIVNDIINEGGGYQVKRSPPTMREWKPVNQTYDLKQSLADDEKLSDEANPPTPIPNLFFYQGLVYFLSIHVPNDVINELTELQILVIYLFGVKVGESSMDLWAWWKYIHIILSFHPKLRVNWVCIAVPLGMNSWIIEQYIHFMHPLLHLNGEWWHRSILNFVPKILELFGTHIISLGKYFAGTNLVENPTKKNVTGRLYATIPHLDNDIRTAFEYLFITEKDNAYLTHRLKLLMSGTKFGYTSHGNYQKRSLIYRYASAWWYGFDVAISDPIDDAYNVEQNVHQLNKSMKKHISGEMHCMMNGIDEARNIIFEATNVGTQIENASRLLHRDYSVSFIKIILHLELTSISVIEKFLEDKCYIVK